MGLPHRSASHSASDRAQCYFCNMMLRQAGRLAARRMAAAPATKSVLPVVPTMLSRSFGAKSRPKDMYDYAGNIYEHNEIGVAKMYHAKPKEIAAATVRPFKGASRSEPDMEF